MLGSMEVFQSVPCLPSRLSAFFSFCKQAGPLKTDTKMSNLILLLIVSQLHVTNHQPIIPSVNMYLAMSYLAERPFLLSSQCVIIIQHDKALVCSFLTVLSCPIRYPINYQIKSMSIKMLGKVDSHRTSARGFHLSNSYCRRNRHSISPKLCRK